MRKGVQSEMKSVYVSSNESTLAGGVEAAYVRRMSRRILLEIEPLPLSLRCEAVWAMHLLREICDRGCLV
jgi:hypothetical protein